MVCENRITKVIPAEFYDRCVVEVASDLIGKLLCRRSRSGLTVGRIVETEAYLAEGDSASHSSCGINRKNTSMFGAAGRAYVYTIHARQCVNVVTEPMGVASAVLIRAVEPLVGVPLMQQRRGTHKRRDLCRGPARLCEAFGIDRALNRWSLTRGQRLWIAETQHADSLAVATSARIGVTSAADLPLRYFVRDNEYVSGRQSLNRRPR